MCSCVARYVAMYLSIWIWLASYRLGMGDIDILAYDYCEAKITIITIIALTISIVKTVYKYL